MIWVAGDRKVRWVTKNCHPERSEGDPPHGPLRYAQGDKTGLPLAAHPLPGTRIGRSSLSRSRKYATVLTNPSASWTRGSQPSHSRAGDVGLALRGIVLRERAVGHSELATHDASHFVDQLRMVNSTGLPRFTGSCRPSASMRAQEALDQIVYVAEGPGLLPFAEDRQVLPAERLDDEVGHHPAVRLRHARAVGVEDAGDPDVRPVLARW